MASHTLQYKLNILTCSKNLTIKLKENVIHLFEHQASITLIAMN